MKSFPALVEFNDGRHSMFPQNLPRSNYTVPKSSLFNDEEPTEGNEEPFMSYSIMFEQYNTLVEMVLAQKTSRLMLQDGARQLNQYKIEGKIGKGRYASVFRATQVYGHNKSYFNKNKVVAMKCMMKKPLNSPFSMNQILKHRARWNQASDALHSSQNGEIDKDDKVARRASTLSLSSTRVMDGDRLIIEMNLLRIRRECLIQSQLPPHPNINAVFEMLDSPKSDRVWMVQEFCSLGELQWERPSKVHIPEQWCEFMKSKSITRYDFAFKLLRDISLGLAFLQEHGVIHRDIKPSNILLDGVRSVAKISDFGCAMVKPSSLPWWQQDREKELWEKAFRDELTKIVGTPAFIPPEMCDFNADSSSPATAKPVSHRINNQLTSDTENGFKIDIWALGVTMYCVLENKLPFVGENEFGTYHMVVYEDPYIDQADLQSQNQDTRWLYHFVVKSLLCKELSKRPFAHLIITKLQHHDKERQSRIGKVKRMFFTWKRRLTKAPPAKNPKTTPSDLIVGTIFSNTSSFSQISSIPTIDSK
ncbi:HDR122Cp [Eremothecium sinecaudum]|uniref:HDR122Cp n=1 Tax=Eremothecium sinecaudum TaxID=45286 RepID=A0A0X8HSW6_9SACH|nr:HDR122Cp [Eremothecium sinecaudum]AMD20864.1 HDR122Cp [Eremothecium sinecaudum]